MRRRGRGETTERTQRGLVRHGSAAAGGPCPDRFGVRLRRRRGRRPHAQAGTPTRSPAGPSCPPRSAAARSRTAGTASSSSTLPNNADEQREQLVRRLAAEDSDIDLISMDVIWTAEFAEAGWILPVPRRGGAAGDRGPARAGGAERDLRGPAVRGAVHQQHPAALVPQEPHAGPADDLGGRARRDRAARGGRASPTSSRCRASATRASSCGSPRLLESAGTQRARRERHEGRARAEGHREGARRSCGTCPRSLGRPTCPVHRP